MMAGSRTRNFSDFRSGFGHDAEIVGVSMQDKSLSVELRGSVIKTMLVPDVFALLLTDLSVQNIIFSIGELNSSDDIRQLFSDVHAEILYPNASQESLISKVMNREAILLHIDATIGLKGFVVTSATREEIQLTTSEGKRAKA